MESVRDNLSTWLNEKLKRTGWSIQEFAKKANISQAHAARIVNGEVYPSAEVYLSMARALGISSETVMHKAGIWPPLPSAEMGAIEFINEVTDLLRPLSIEDRQLIYDIVKLHYQRVHEK